MVLKTGSTKDLEELTDGLYEEAQGMYDQLVAWRRSLHQMPELGIELPKSSAFIQKQLDEMGISYTTYVDGSCVVAMVGNTSGPCILLRADFDALPVCEQSGEPFASTNGCMHACGHDMHAAMLLGAAKLLKEREDKLPGCVKLLFQPGEEGAHSAALCVEQGVLENPKPAVGFAIHVGSEVPLGTWMWGIHALSRAKYFQVVVEGEGGHGSTPEVCIDPITPAAYIHLGFQELVTREISGKDIVVLTTGTFQAGDAPNVIPASATLRCNLRTFDDDLHDKLWKRIHEISEGVANTYRTKATVSVLSDDPMLVCDEAMSKLASGAVRKAEPDTTMLDNSMQQMASEDFSYIARELPSAFFMLGAKVDDEKVYGQHNPHVRFNEKALPMGAAAHVAVALTWLFDQTGK